jgi:phosphohistidine phosphatase
MFGVKLWVIRHAKSSWAEPGQSDFERPLNKRGNADGRRVAAWLAEQSEPATWIWTSDAARALETAQFVAQGFAGASACVVCDHRLYHATAEAACEVLQETPGDIASVVLVAHNPGLTWLVNQLAAESVVDNLPTFGVARFNITGAWHEFNSQAATFEWLMLPRELRRSLD